MENIENLNKLNNTIIILDVLSNTNPNGCINCAFKKYSLNYDGSDYSCSILEQEIDDDIMFGEVVGEIGSGDCENCKNCGSHMGRLENCPLVVRD
jgi:hypothetical protein